VPINIDMSLHQGHWLVLKVIAGTKQVYIQDLMVSNDTEYSLIVVCGFLGVKLNDDANL
jgi:hypothetical protein